MALFSSLRRIYNRFIDICRTDKYITQANSIIHLINFKYSILLEFFHRPQEIQNGHWKSYDTVKNRKN